MNSTAVAAAIVVAAGAVAGGAVYVWQQHWSPEATHREIVRERLFDPESARFRNAFRGPNSTLVWCGEVNARNRMGGFTGYSRYIVLLAAHAPRDPAQADVLLDQRSTDEATFEGRWSVYCYTR